MAERALQRWLFYLSLALAFPSRVTPAQQLTFKPYYGNGTYKVGESIGWTVQGASSTDETPARFTWTARKNNLDTVKAAA